MVGDRLDLVGGLQHPALAPGVHDPVASRAGGQVAQRQLEDDRVHVPAGLGVDAAVDEAEVAFGILRVTGRPPRSSGPGGRSSLLAVPEARMLRVEVEQVVALELEERLRDGQLAQVGAGVGDVVELGRVVDRPEESGQVVEERVVAPAQEEPDLVPSGASRSPTESRSTVTEKLPPGKFEEVDLRPPLGVGTSPALSAARSSPRYFSSTAPTYSSSVSRLGVVVTGHSTRGAVVIWMLVEHVGVEHARRRHRRERQGDDDPLAAGLGRRSGIRTCRRGPPR